MTSSISGIFNILATPFNPDDSLDLAGLRRLVDFQMELGAHGLTILGVLGEAAKLSVNERREVMEAVMDTVNGRVPVVVGASHQDDATRLALCRAAEDAGAAGVMVAPPRMKTPLDEAVFAIYSDLAQGCDMAIVVQDFPPVNDIFMSAQLIAGIARGIPAARYLKLEDPPLMQKISDIRAEVDGLEIFGGLGGMFLLEELGRGASGTMTGFAFTEILIAVYDAWSSGQGERAQALFDHYLPLIRFENQPVINLSIRKELLRRRGAFDCARPRPPYAAIDEGTLQEIDWVFERVGIDDPTRKIEFDTTGVLA